MEPANGRIIGDYALLQQIGSGSFADVWKAQHTVTRDVVAIKEIATDKLNRKLLQSLDSEVSILRRISHRNIVKLHTVIEVGTRPKSIMFLACTVPSSTSYLGSLAYTLRSTRQQLCRVSWSGGQLGLP